MNNFCDMGDGASCFDYFKILKWFDCNSRGPSRGPHVLNGIKVWGVSWPWFRIFFPCFALCQCFPSCWKRHCSSPNCFWLGSFSQRRFLYHSFIMAVFFCKILNEHTPLAEKQLHMRGLRKLYCWHDTDTGLIIY